LCKVKNNKLELRVQYKIAFYFVLETIDVWFLLPFQALRHGGRVLVKYKNSIKDNAIKGLMRARNWLDDSVGKVFN
jgi:hypothetical protein